MQEYVIIGNGIAAAACIEGIRSMDAEGPITVVSREPHPAYCRPLISYYLEDRTDPDRMRYRDADFYEKNGCTVLYGKSAAAIDAAAHRVTLEDGTVLPYTRLCAATGSDPFVPSIPGLDSVPEKHLFMTFDDAEALKKAVTKSSRVLIIGAGMIGLKCAEGLHSIAGQVTVCDMADRILSSVLDKESAQLMQRQLTANGIRLLLSDSVARFEGNTAHLQSGGTEDFDILVMAIGVRPCAALVQAAGGKTNRGILVDTAMRTSLPDIYAAGDCTESLDTASGEMRVLAVLPNAYAEGFCAGVNMAGGDKVFEDAIAMNSVALFGLHSMTAGCDLGGEVYAKVTEDSVKKLFYKDDRLTGFILVGCTERAGIYTAMIREQTPLDQVDFALLKKMPTSAAYLQEKRRKMFGGVV